MWLRIGRMLDVSGMLERRCCFCMERVERVIGSAYRHEHTQTYWYIEVDGAAHRAGSCSHSLLSLYPDFGDDCPTPVFTTTTLPKYTYHVKTS